MTNFQTNLLKWIHQPTDTSGVQIPYDFGTDILTTLYPEVVIGAQGSWMTIPTFSNVYNFPRAKRFNESDLKEVVLGQAMNLDYISGEYVPVVLDHQLAIGKVFQNFEIISSGADYVRFFIEEAVKQFARAYENWTVIDLIQQGTDGIEFLTDENGNKGEAATGRTDIYETLLALRAQMKKNGSNVGLGGNVDLYVTPEIITLLMVNRFYIPAGQCDTQAYEVRNGFMGRILGFNVYESGRYALMEPVAKTVGGKTVAVKSNIIAVDNSQVRKIEHKVQPITMVRAPENFPADCSILKGLEYFTNYVVNKNGVYYLNAVVDAK